MSGEYARLPDRGLTYVVRGEELSHERIVASAVENVRREGATSPDLMRASRRCADDLADKLSTRMPDIDPEVIGRVLLEHQSFSTGMLVAGIPLPVYLNTVCLAALQLGGHLEPPP